jgi:hypothetical protein
MHKNSISLFLEVRATLQVLDTKFYDSSTVNKTARPIITLRQAHYPVCGVGKFGKIWSACRQNAIHYTE